MKNLWKFVQKYYEIIGYSVLTILLFCACFFPVFAWIVAGYIVIFALLLHKEVKMIGLLLYLNCFYVLFNYQSLFGLTLDIVIVGFLIATVFVLYLVRVVKREYKLNWKTLVPIGSFLIYVVLPFHECYWIDFFAMVFFFVILYIVFEERKQIDFRYLVRIFVGGIIISCIFALFRNVSPLLSEKIQLHGYNYGELSFQGLSFHQNTLSGLITLAICAILTLKYKDKISIWELLLTFIPLFIFGYLTLSRAFIFTVFAGMIVFALFYLVKRKLKALLMIGILSVIICSVGGIFSDITRIYIKRVAEEEIYPLETQSFNVKINPVNLDYNFYNQSEDWQAAVWSGQIRFDPGRNDLRELYLIDWSSSNETMWLGRGISRPLIGQMSSHNLLVQELWKHGIVGYIFYALIILGSINWKKLKSLLRYLPILIMLTPYLMKTLVEQCLYDYIELILIITAGSFLGQKETSENKLINNEVEPGEK
jgi:hypothetical protein